MKRFILFLALIFSPIISFSQTVSGFIYDKSTLKPLDYANVYLPELRIGVASNKNGYFEINLTNISIPERFLIRISYVGYKTISQILTKNDLNKSLKFYLEQDILSSQTILVTSSVGRERLLPITYSNVSKVEIEKRFTIQDFPQFLSEFPSVISYSENGNGLGYNYMSIRGFDQRRISVTINGIPQNDPEDHNVYWIDFPDLLEDVNNIQIQRGVSSNLIGSPAIGGSINIITSPFTQKREIKLTSGFGSFNTRKLKLSFNSGLIDNYALYARVSKINSSGYRENSWVDFFSYFVSFIRYDDNMTNQLNIFGAPIADGLAYTGLPKWTISDKTERKKNYSYWEDANGQYTFVTPRRVNEIENFNQPHLELLSEFKIQENLKFNSALFAYWGKGFFDYDGSWADTSYFRMTYENGFASTPNLSNALIRAYVDNTHFGWIPRLQLNSSLGDFIVGLELRRHRSLHWGSVWYAQGLPAGPDQTWRYYEYKGAKDVFGGFIFYQRNILTNLKINLESQLVYNRTRLYDEKFVGTDFTVNNLFLNPKIGFVYDLNSNTSFYGYVANVSREPRLKNYYDAAESSGGEVPQFELDANGNYDFSKPLVKNENLTNVEFGFSKKSNLYSFNVNLFYMYFKDEIIKRGMVDRFGQPKTGNADRTTHTGIEFSGELRPIQNVSLNLNLSYMKNIVNKGFIYMKYRDPITNQRKVAQIDLAGFRIPNSPELIGNLRLTYDDDKLFASLSANYVGKQFTDNFDNKLNELLTKYPRMVNYKDNIVPDYFVVNFDARYKLEVPYLGKVTLFGRINNLFNRLYAAYGIGNEFFPAAERNFFGGIELSL
ncbi:MAG: TonB-dependent receptor [Ignavibacteria bacterium]|jgi:iron complex outermembrane receptor protein|nr:TonB-dependent receptor [Ignavibacteria bacterium]MDH7527674.1 TonB-dependent receptor [Ignavibacteria bacterium]